MKAEQKIAAIIDTMTMDELDDFAGNLSEALSEQGVEVACERVLYALMFIGRAHRFSAKKK
jgi:hypothetical protein